MRRLLAFICILGISGSSFAQTNKASWTNLNGLKPGQEIQLVEMNSQKDSGVFVSMSDSAITYSNTVGTRTVLRSNVRTIKLMKPNHRGRNMLIGAGVSAGAGAGIGAAAWDTSGILGDRRIGALGGGLIGVLCGTIIGFVAPTHGSTTIYDTSSH
jgi:hypothetical protein